MAFGLLGNRDQSDCVRIIHAALDAGINCIDTADIYSHGESEHIVGKALSGRRDRVILASKCFWPMSEEPNDRGLSRKWIFSSVNESLHRLGTDYLDVFFMHKPDPHADLLGSLTAMSDLVRQGKTHLVGTSSFPAEQLVEAHWLAQMHGLIAPSVEQPAYSLFARGAERSVLPTCQRQGWAVMAAAPLNGGWLTGHHRRGRAVSLEGRQYRWAPRQFAEERPPVKVKLRLVERLAQLASEAGLTMSALALGFATEHPAISTVVVGPRTMSQLQELLAAADCRLSSDVLDELDRIVSPGSDIDPDQDAWYEPPALAAGPRRRSQSAIDSAN